MSAVSYKIVNSNGDILKSHNEEACFYHLPGFDAKLRDVGNTLIYRPKVKHISDKQAERFLSNLKEIGFTIKQTPHEVLNVGYHLKFSDFLRGKEKDHLSVSEIGAHLTAVRYVTEFAQVIGRYFNLLDMAPKFNKWKALQLVHYVSVFGAMAHEGRYEGDGHVLMSKWNSVIPYKTWKQVVSSWEKEPAWGVNQRFRICRTLGKRCDYVRDLIFPIGHVTNIQDLEVIDDYFKKA